MMARSALAMNLSALTLALAGLISARPLAAQQTQQTQQTIELQPPTVPAAGLEDAAPTPPSVPAPTPGDTAAPQPVVSEQPQLASPAVAREPQYRDVTRWYGALTLAVDAASAVVALTALAFDPMLGLGFGGYLFGAPLVHLAHDNPGIAGLSLVMRLAFPALLFSTGFFIEDCGDGGEYCVLGSLLVGVPVGILAAIIVDSAALAYQTVREPVAVQPLVSVRRDALWLGFGGAL